MVVLHSYQHRRGLLGGTGRYAAGLAAALPAAGEPVVPLVVRPWEIHVAGRRVGGLASIQLQHLVRRGPRGDLMHSVNALMLHPKAGVATLHDLHAQRFGQAWGLSRSGIRLMEARFDAFLRRGGQVITPTAAVKDQLLQHRPDLPAERVQVTYEGIADLFRPAGPQTAPHPAFGPDRFNVLVVADLHPRKRLDLVLEAAGRFPSGSLRVVQAGTVRRQHPAWEAQARREQEAERGFDGLVRLGHVGEADLVRAYQSADLVVTASEDEGFGFPPLEALRCGTPATVSDLPVFRELLGDHATYFRDVDGLERAIAGAMRAPPGAARRAGLHAFVRDTYTWARTARLTREAYAAARARHGP